MAENKINQAELDEKQLNEENLDEVNGGYWDYKKFAGDPKWKQELDRIKSTHVTGERRKS